MQATLPYYSKDELRRFKLAAKAIRNHNETMDHTQATAEFLDTEVSDNSGRVQRILRSRSNWKKSRLDVACQKAAKIMEDRYLPFYYRCLNSMSIYCA